MQTQYDPVSLMVALLAAGLSPSVGAALGPYAVIFLAATTGAAWTLSRRTIIGKAWAFWFFLKINITACLLTSGIATVIGSIYHTQSFEWMFAGIAFILGLVGDEWPAVGRWVLNAIHKRLGAAPKE